MRSLSSQAIQEMFSETTDEVYVVLITIDHDDLVIQIRVCSDSVDTVSNGETFFSFPFDISLPDDQEGSPSRATVTVDNVHKDLTDSLRMISSPPSFLIQLIRASAPDDFEASFQPLKMKGVKVDALQVSGELTADDQSVEPFPYENYTPSRYPGLF